MRKGKGFISDDNNEHLDDIAGVLVKEDQQINLAGGYIDFFAGIGISSVDDFVEVIQESLDEYIGRRYALQVVGELNRYISTWEDFAEAYKVRHGGKSNAYKEVCRIGNYIDSDPRVANVWEMKKTGKNLFNKFLAIVSKDNSDLIPKPTVARMALLRFYICHLAEKLIEETKYNRGRDVMSVKYAFNIGSALSELNLAFRLLDKDTLARLHTIGARANKTKRDSEEYKDLSSVARAAWDFGCDLLHTQMLYLFVLNGKVALSSKGETSVKNKLKKIAPHNRVYGPGTEKIIDACPCDKRDQCPLIKKINPKKRYDLPVSKKHLK